jgi:hypothetical protein
MKSEGRGSHKMCRACTQTLQLTPGCRGSIALTGITCPGDAAQRKMI